MLENKTRNSSRHSPAHRSSYALAARLLSSDAPARTASKVWEDYLQNRYAGDVGDYVKLAILRQLSPGHRLGVLWWLYPDEDHNADGKHVAYLKEPLKWRQRDPALFDALNAIVTSGERSVSALQSAGTLADTTFFANPIPTTGPSHDRRSNRALWFAAALNSVNDCDLVFLDPDNGLETANYDAGLSRSGKSVALVELEALRRRDRTIIVYHHQTRMAGGHHFELKHWGRRLADLGFTVDALRASAFSARAFFLLDASPDIRSRAEAMARQWGEKLTWHPCLDKVS